MAKLMVTSCQNIKHGEASSLGKRKYYDEILEACKSQRSCIMWSETFIPQSTAMTAISIVNVSTDSHPIL